MLNNLNSERMNIIQKLDDWYKEWRGVSHLEESNLQVLDSSDAQDFARYCIDEYKGLVSGDEQSSSNCNIPLVSNNEVTVCDCHKGKFVFNEVKQELICGCGRRIKITN